MQKKIISTLLCLFILLVTILLPLFKFNFDVITILTVVTLLFTILVGFFIAATTANYLRLQTIISNEDANLISIYSLVKILQPSAKKKIGNLIDNYMIAALDYDLLDYIEPTSKEIQELLNALDKIVPTSNKTASLLQNLHTLRSNMVSFRQEMEVLVKRVITKKHWFILTSLAIIISTILLSFRNENIFSSLLIGLLIITMYKTLNLLHQIDSNSFLADQLAYETPQKVFIAIEKKKYFPQHALNEKIIKKLGNEEYRVGYYKNFSKSMKKEIKIIKKFSKK